jgi:hypothetical protein
MFYVTLLISRVGHFMSRNDGKSNTENAANVLHIAGFSISNMNRLNGYRTNYELIEDLFLMKNKSRSTET